MINVSFEKNVYSISFLREFQQFGNDWSSHVTLQQLIDECSTATGVKAENIKLLYAGETTGWSEYFWNIFQYEPSDPTGQFVLLKQKTATLAQYNIKQNSKIFMLASRDKIEGPTVVSQPSRTESLLLSRLDSILEEATETVFPLVNQFKSSADSSEISQKQKKDLYAKASEYLMQTLLKVDGVVCEPEFQQARLKRKDLVKLLQDNLNELDQLKSTIELDSFK